ncbi:hypothetical protein VE03_05180, partial [Pseudogymnoascus sp. 23342-1-I1]
MPRLVRRKPLSERLKAYLNPLDFLLYVSEELETSEWDTVGFGRALGMGLNFALLLARANNPTTDVWELAVWDPLPLALEVYTLFSPGHAVVYWMLLPVGGGERPSLTVATALVLQGLLSVQMSVLVRNFGQKERDGRVVQREVLNEYDTKFVHPTLHPVVRDVGTQISTSTSTSTGTDAADEDASTISITEEDVTAGTPTTILRRGFRINPNPNYAAHISPHAPAAVPSRNSLPPSTPHTPLGQMGYHPTPQPASSVAQFQQPQFQPQRRESTPLRGTPAAVREVRQPQYRASMGGRISSDVTGPSSSSGVSRGASGTGGGDGDE